MKEVLKDGSRFTPQVHTCIFRGFAQTIIPINTVIAGMTMGTANMSITNRVQSQRIRLGVVTIMTPTLYIC